MGTVGEQQGTARGQDSTALSVPGVERPVEIGRGGFGTVYRAWQARYRRTVALKVLHKTLTDAALREQFERECAASGLLSNHPNIVDYFGSGVTAAGRPYILMDYMPAGSLGDRVGRHGPAPWADVLDITVEMAGALETAHRAGVVHRDVKPENILTSMYGIPQLGDFGIVELQGAAETARASKLSGSLAHVAPELLAHAPSSVATDLYALGSTMFVLLTGRTAFVRDADRSLGPVLARIAHEPVPDLRPFGVPDGVCLVVERLMAKHPAHRYPSAAQLGWDIQALQGQWGLPVTRMALPLH